MEEDKTKSFDPNKKPEEDDSPDSRDDRTRQVKISKESDEPEPSDERTEIFTGETDQKSGSGVQDRTRVVQPGGDQRTDEEERLEGRDTEEKTEVIRREEEQETVVKGKTPHLEEEKASLPPARPGYLLGIHGPLFGKRFSLDSGPIRIGRDRKLNDIFLLQDHKASRRHATISVVGGEYAISDKRSRNRTYVNQKILGEKDEVILKEKDEIEIGETIFRFTEGSGWDFSWPKKAGIFKVRWQYPLFLIFSSLLVIVSLSFAAISWNRMNLINQIPESIQMSRKNLSEGTKDLSPGGVSSFSEEGELPLHPSTGLIFLNQEDRVGIVYVNPEGNISLLDGKTLNPIWKGTSKFAISQGSSPTLSDMNNDGTMDLAIATRSARVAAIDGRSGFQIWISPSLGGNIESTPAVGDLDGDGRKDVVVASVGGQVHFGYSRGTSPEWEAVSLHERVYSSPTLADFDQDGFFEVLIGTDEGMLYGLDGKTREREFIVDVKDELSKSMGVKYVEDLQFRSPCSAGDITGDGTPDIIATARQGIILFFDGLTRSLLGFKKFKRPERLLPERHSAPLIADLNGDHRMDVISTSNAGDIRAFMRGTGGIQPLWEFALGEKNRLIGTPALGDVNKDGTPDIVVCGEDGKISLLDGRFGARERLLWQDSVSVSITTSPAIADVDGDGSLDILITDNLHNLTLFNTNSRVFKNEIIWGMLYGSSSHQGSLILQKRSVGIYQIFFLFSLVFFFGNLANFSIVQVRRRRKIEKA
jgi:outer membrane protein assembly factor BamB